MFRSGSKAALRLFPVYCIVLIFSFHLLSCSKKNPASEGRVTLTYWEKWTNFERDAMQRVVDKYNASQKTIFIQLVTVSQVEQKFLVATAAGKPPDLCGVYEGQIPIYAEKGALTELSPFFAQAGLSEKHFLPGIWTLMNHLGKTWAMTTTPASVGLHWNKKLFEGAGLNPESPPKTIQELTRISDKLTLFADPKTHGKISFEALIAKFGSEQKATQFIESQKLDLLQIGFLPSEPGWWPAVWGHFFGGRLFENGDKIAVDSKEYIQAYEWVQSFAKKYGAYNVKKFASGFGQFASPQNAFLSGKVAMVLQGVWMHNYISKFTPGLAWGAAPFPVTDPSRYGTTAVFADMLVIPKGARHPAEAFEFIKYVSQPENMELLCAGQEKFSPLAQVSDSFYVRLKHPYIRVFRHMAESPDLFMNLRSGIVNVFSRDMAEAFSRIWLMNESPEKVLGEVAIRNQRALNENLLILNKTGKLPFEGGKEQ